MTTAAHAYQNRYEHISLRDYCLVASLRFAEINRKNLITLCLLSIMGLGAVHYLGALYMMFSFGLQLQSENRIIGALGEQTNTLELQAQRIAANFPEEHKESLRSMEKISGVRYVMGENAAVSYIPVRP